MKKIPKQEYTAEFKAQAVDRAQLKAAAAGKLTAPGTKPVTPAQMELSRLAAPARAGR